MKKLLPVELTCLIVVCLLVVVAVSPAASEEADQPAAKAAVAPSTVVATIGGLRLLQRAGRTCNR
jgi:hypothetical protein